MPTITLPTLHADQARVYRARGRHNAVNCGRRWGKDILQNTIACDAAAKGKKVGIFTPEHKQWQEPFGAILGILAPIVKSRDKSNGKITTTTGGVIDFWATDDNLLAGRGREYHLALLNEAAFTKSPQMLKEVWPKAIKPTMLTTKGQSWVFSTPLGIDPDNFFYNVCHDDPDFVRHHAPSINNPLVDPAEIEKIRARENPMVFRQEYLGEFVDWSGAAFFSLDKWLIDGKPAPMPKQCLMVFAVIDTALKSGKEHDGTATLYCAVMDYYLPQRHQKLVLLDYELVQIDSDLLTMWMPNVYQRLEMLAAECGALMGSKGCLIEDKNSGTTLLQHAQRQGWAATPIDGAFVAGGKDEKALAVSSWHHQGFATISEPCLAKVIEFKGATRNHLVSQVTGFRLADKDAHKRADDLMDVYTSALHATFGENRES